MRDADTHGLRASPQAGSRRWADEIVYAIIVEKFFDGDPSNNYMGRHPPPCRRQGLQSS
jgi:hypothetical protein